MRPYSALGARELPVADAFDSGIAFERSLGDGHTPANGPAAGRWSALRSLAAAVLFVVVAMAAVMASAQSTLYWDTNGTADGSGAATGTWGTSNFWNTDPTGGAGGAFQTATTSADNLFISAGTNGTAGTITVGTTQSANSLTFQNNVSVTVSGGTAINLGSTTGAGIFMASGVNSSNTVSTPLVLGGNVSFQNLGNAAALNVSGNMTGTGNIAITSNGVGSTVPLGTTTTTLNSAGTVSYSGTSFARTQISAILGNNVTGVTSNSNAGNFGIASPTINVNINGTTFTNNGIQSLTFRGAGQTVTGTGDLILKSNSPYSIPMSIDFNGNQQAITINHTGAITNSGTGLGGARIDAQIATNVTAINQNSATSNLYLVNVTSNPGNGPITQSNNSFTAPVNINAGILYSGYVNALTTSGTITFRGGTLMYGAASATDLTTKMTTDGTSPYSLDTNGVGVSASALAASGTSGLNKFGPGTLTLTGNSTYTGTTRIGGGTSTLERLDGGTLQVGDGTTGSLNGTTGTALTFAGTGTFNVQKAANSTQGMQALTFSAGDGTVQSTYAGTSGVDVSTVSFTSVGVPAAGATANYVNSGSGTNGVDNKIVLGGQAAGVMGKASYFGGSAYAAYDAGGFVRAIAYGSDTNAPAAIAGGATLGVNDATQNVQVTAAITGQTAAAVNTINMTSGAAFKLASGTLAVNGLLRSGGSSTATVISGGNGITTTAAGGDLVARADASADTLMIRSPVLDNGTSSFTKSGAGVVWLTGANTYAGNTAINQGVLVLSTPANRSYNGVITGAGTLAVTGPGTLTLTNPATLTGGITISQGTLLLDYTGAGVPNTNLVNGVNTLTLGSGGGSNIPSGGGTLLIKGKSSGITSQNLSVKPPPETSPGVVTNAGSSRILVDPNGGTATQVLMGQLQNVIARNGNLERVGSNGSTLLIGKTAGAGSGDARFMYATDGRNGGPHNNLNTGRLVYTNNGGADVDFIANGVNDNATTPYVLTPVGTNGTVYTPMTSTTFTGGWMRLAGSDASVTTNSGTATGLKIANPDAGRSITINAGQTWVAAAGIIMTGSNDFTIAGGNLGTTNANDAYQRAYVIQQYSTGTLTIASTLAEVGTNNCFIKSGPGRLVLSGTNTFGGPTYINEGVLTAGSAQNGTTSGPLGANGVINFTGGTLQYSSDANIAVADYSPRFATGGGMQYMVDTNGRSVTFGTALASAGGSLTKSGSGTLTLNAVGNAYTGTTSINGGTLALGASALLAYTPVIDVASGATFDVTGKLSAGLTLSQFAPQELKGDGLAFGNFTLGTSSALTPGASGVGTLSFDGNLTLSGSSVFNFELGSDATAGTTYDQVKLLSTFGGTFDLGAGVINFSNFNFTPLTGFGAGTYTLFDGGFATTGAGTLGSSLTGQINGLDATLSQSGTSVLLTVTSAVPEPGTLVLLAAAGVAAAVARHRRRQ
jgi:autotransporter-associated beta strand protein